MKISVIIPSYNRYKLLKRALVSVFSQTYLPFEVIVIDDGSTDNTSQIETFVLKTFISVIPNSIGNLVPKFRYFYQENAGVSSARNLGIQKATSEWIAFLDSDDEWHVYKLQKQVAFHKENPDILMSYTDEKWVRDGIAVKIPKKFQKVGGAIFESCLSHCIIAPSAVVISQEILNRVENGGKFFDESLEVCEDYDLWLRVALNHKIGLVDQKLITKYAGHENQLSFKHWGMDRWRVVALEKLYIQEHSSEKKIVIEKELIKKYTLLLKGAVKYAKIADVKIYESKLAVYGQG